MRFRHAKRPNRQRIRNVSQDRVEPLQAEVLRDNLPGSESFPSGVSVGDPTEPPAKVTGVTVTAGLRTMLVEWDRLEDFQTVDGAGGYEVQLDYVATFDDTPRTQRTSATMASFTDLLPNTTYFVRVRGVQGTDNYGEWSDWDSTFTVQAEEDDIQASAVTADKIAANAVTASKLAAITMEVGKYIQSDNYDGTDVDTNDATQGFRIEADGDAEFRDVRVRGDLRANTLVSTSGDDNLISNWDFETPTPTGWSTDVGMVVWTTYAESPHGTGVLAFSNNTGSAQRPTLTYGDVEGLVPGAAYFVAISGARDQAASEIYYVDMHVDWYDDADTLLSTDTFLYERITGHDFFTVVGGHDNPVFAPDTVSYAKVRIEFTSDGDAVPDGEKVYFDAFQFAPYTYFKGAYVESMASIELTRSYDPRSPNTKLQPGYLYMRVPEVFEDDFNSVPTIFSDVGDYGSGKRESVMGIYTGRPELTGGGDGDRAHIELQSGRQDGSATSRIELNSNELQWPDNKVVWPAPYAEGITTLSNVTSGDVTPMTGLSGSNPDGMLSSGWAFVAPRDGVYLFWVYANTNHNVNNCRFLVGASLNGSSSTVWVNDCGINSTATAYVSGSYPIQLNEGDYLEGRVYQDSGSTASSVGVRARMFLMAPR